MQIFDKSGILSIIELSFILDKILMIVVHTPIAEEAESTDEADFAALDHIKKLARAAHKSKLERERAEAEFAAMEHVKKLAKIKEMLYAMKGKSDFFAQLYANLKNKDDMSDNMLDYLYKILSDMINDETKKLVVSDEDKILKKLKANIQ